MALRPLPFVAVLAALSAAALPAAAEAVDPRLEERMSSEEFRAAGLDRLSREQLDYLNRWLGAKEPAAIAAPPPRSGVAAVGGDSVAPPRRERIDSRIVGVFHGWRGRTLVTLENGQKWRQSESGSHGDVVLDGPEVTIKPMSMGSWLMIVKGCNCSIRVKPAA